MIKDLDIEFLLIKTGIFSLLMLMTILAAGQSGSIRGFIYDEGTGEPIIFTNVVLKGTTYGTSTDINGFFSIVNIPVGTYTLISTYIGYDTARADVTIIQNNASSVKLFIRESTIALEGVEVSAERQEKRTEVQVSTQTVTSEAIKQLPSVGGEPDIAQYLQVIPGVIFTGDQGGQIYIRGGSPVQTKFLLDGMTIYNPFHSIGLFSVFETEAIKNVDVHTGGFNAEHGNRISAVVDVTTRDGNKKRLSGKVSANPFLAKAILEGPIKKLRDDGSSASFLLTSKYSYLNRTSKSLYSYADSNGIPYKFLDFYGKISATSKSGSKFNLFGFNYTDDAQFQGVSDFSWNAAGGGGNFIVVPGQSNIYLTTNFNYSRYKVDLTGSDDRPRTSSINGFNLEMNFTYFISNGEINYGIDVTGFSTTFEFFNPLGIIIDQNQNTTEIGAFFSFNKHWDNFVIEPSLRLQYYGSLGELSPEPRLGFKWNITDNIRFKLATGIYSQNLISTKSDRDVVNLFTGFLSGPEEELTKLNGEPSNTKLQRAFHLIGGVELDVNKYITLNVEPYYKDFFQLVNLNRNKLFPEESNYQIETGDAYGVDFLVNADYKGLFVWLAYSLGYVTREDVSQTYNPHFDRRHNLNLVTGYSFGKKKDWEASARWNLGSGFPFTKTKGFYEQLFLFDGVNSTTSTDNGNLGIIYDDELNGGRLPYYHRLDISLKKRFSLTKYSDFELVAGVTNVYDRENIFYFDRVKFDRVNQLPIIPTLGASLSF